LECAGETAGINPVGVNSSGIKKPAEKTGRPVSLLQAAERYKQGGKVIVEQNGIHFISSETFGRDSGKEELNGDFKELVESVVGKK
jgi:hypothetical protein